MGRAQFKAVSKFQGRAPPDRAGSGRSRPWRPELAKDRWNFLSLCLHTLKEHGITFRYWNITDGYARDVMRRRLVIVCVMGAGWLAVSGSAVLLAATAFGLGR
jgi:hypothetical protein